MAEITHHKEKKPPRSDRWLLIVVLLLFLLGVGIRGYAYFTTSSTFRSLQPQQSQNYTAKAFPDAHERSQIQEIPSSGSPSPEGNSFFPSLAPYLTEGGLSFFLGFCLGYVLRLVAKVAIIAVGAIYFCLIVLSHYGIITVDWGSFQQIIQQLLLNTETQLEGLQGLVTHSLPSIVMGGIGMWRGVKRS
ncbi:hypothetical protein CSA56_17780 [candidate division KSB3 bacterium]|uniref:FUN14 domain-containing protein n=1 Tax=candidate division KSB3 bacterium TaxID=2044937 RepID=A0A2G6K7F4_9BACT|nr:MAG: hypothetical protein CSA56_17780 [candidate division KSB3 bacterium]